MFQQLASAHPVIDHGLKLKFLPGGLRDFSKALGRPKDGPPHRVIVALHLSETVWHRWAGSF